MKTSSNQKTILQEFKKGSTLLYNTVSKLSESELDYLPSKGGWTIREIIHHIADGDDIWKSAIKMALGNEENEFSLSWYTSFPQIEWARRWTYNKRSIGISLELFKANRAHIVQLLENAKDGLNRKIKFRNFDGKIETIDVQFIIEMQTEHVTHHLKRIGEIIIEISGKEIP